MDGGGELRSTEGRGGGGEGPVKAQIWDHLLYRHWNHYVGPKRSHVLVVSATDGNAIRDLTPRQDIGDAEAPTFSLGGPMGYAWAPDSQEIAYVTNLDLVPAASTNNDVFTLRLDEPGAKPVRISTSPGSDDAPAYSPDGKWLAFRSQARAGYESDRFRLMLYDRTGEASQHDSAGQPGSAPAGQRDGAAAGQKLVKPVNIPGDGVPGVDAEVRPLGGRVCVGAGLEGDVSCERRCGQDTGVTFSV